jgi:anti-sigma regulatory factor (Ser/Thr protein kinase)
MSAPPASDSAGDQALPGSPQRLTEIGRVTLAGRAENVRPARRFVAGLLGRDWPRLDDVLVLASEVAANAIRHTASGQGGHFEVTVAMCAARSRVRVEVTDQGGSSVPRPADAAADDPDTPVSGRGLMVVDVLADQWGHHGDERGRVVWFEVTAKPEPATTPG